VFEYITSPANIQEIELLGFNRVRRPLRVRDLPVAREQIRGWAEYLKPAGFREGLAVALFTRDGRHLGLLGLNTDTDRHPTEAARDLIGMLAPTIASAVDPLRSIASVAGIVGDARVAVVLTRAGHPLSLPGLPSHALLRLGSAVPAVAAERLADRVYSSFLCPYPSTDAANDHVRITMLPGPARSPYDLAAVVLVSPPGDTCGLTPRELEILGLLVEAGPTAGSRPPWSSPGARSTRTSNTSWPSSTHRPVPWPRSARSAWASMCHDCCARYPRPSFTTNVDDAGLGSTVERIGAPNLAA